MPLAGETTHADAPIVPGAFGPVIEHEEFTAPEIL